MKSKFLIIILSSLTFIGCEKDAKVKAKDYPIVFTKDVIEINQNGATFGAEVIQNPGAEIIDFGFICKNASSEIKISLVNETTLEDFKYRVSVDLEDGIIYSVQAFLQTKKFLVLGNEVIFKSLGSSDPVILSFNPTSGADGTIVTILGKNFSHLQSNNKVFVNNMSAQVISSSGDTIVIKTPRTAFIGSTKISVKVGTKSVLTNDLFNVIGPKIESVTSLSGFSGEYLSLFGINFTLNSPNVEIKFDAFTAQIIKFSDTRIDIVVPSIPTSLLAEISVSIKLINGLKTIIYKDRFLIKKSWESKTAPPFSWSWFYKAFTYNEKGYILELNTNEFYEYNPITDQWNTFPSTLFPGTRYNGSLYILTGDKLFKAGGYDMGDQKFSDLWVFDFNAKTWNKKNDIPFKFLDAVSINLNNLSYVITDDGQVWKCDFINEQYTRLNDSPFSFKYAFASNFNYGGKDFVVTYGQTWQYNIQNDSWTKFSTNPFTKSSYSQQDVGFSYKGTGYVLQAGQYLYKYDINANTWVKTSQYPGIRGDNSYKTVFVIGSKAYFAATSSNYVGGAPLMYLYQE